MSSTIIDDSSRSNIIEPESEVRKLQDLVKKLQQQNQILLRRQSQPSQSDVENSDVDTNYNSSTASNSGSCLETDATSRASNCSGILREQQLNTANTRLNAKSDDAGVRTSDDATDVCKGHRADKPTLDTVRLIDIDRISLDEEDSWLYKSPQQQQVDCYVSPHDWLRADFNQPSPELLTTRRSLVSKLDEITRASQVDLFSTKLVKRFEACKSAGDIASQDSGDVTEIIAVEPGSNCLHRTITPSSYSKTLPRCSGGKDAGRNSSRLVGYRRASTSDSCRMMSNISTGLGDNHWTNEVSKSTEVLVGNDNMEAIEFDCSGVTTFGIGDVDVNSLRCDQSFKRTSTSEENLLSSGYRLNDVMDVKQLARLQEENLRLSYNAPLISSKKGLSKSLNRSSGALAVEDTSDPSRPLVLNHSSCSLLQPVSCSPCADVVTAKLDNNARHTSRSAGNLLACPVDNEACNTTSPGQNVSLNGTLSGNMTSRMRMPVSSSERTASGLRTPRSGLRTPRLQAAKQTVRSTSTPRSIAGVGRQLGRLSFAPSNSLPSSPHSSDHDLDLQPADVDAEEMAHGGYRQSLPNLTRASKLSLPLTTHSSDLQLAGTGLTQPNLSSSSLRQNTATAKNTSLIKQPPTRHPPSPSRNTKNSMQPTSNISRQPPSPTTAASQVPGRSTATNFSRHPPSPTRSAPVRDNHPPSPTGGRQLTDKSTAPQTNGSSRQPSRLIAPSRSRIPSPSARKNVVSAAVASNDDSWKDGCF